MTVARYAIDKMRVVRTSGKTADKNPDRLMTVTGTFYSLSENPKKAGEYLRSEHPLTVPSKNIDKSDAFLLDNDGAIVGANPDFAISVENGTLTLPAGDRGRKAAVGETAEGVASFLAGLIPATE